jgi:hypothetical protein
LSKQNWKVLGLDLELLTKDIVKAINHTAQPPQSNAQIMDHVFILQRTAAQE